LRLSGENTSTLLMNEDGQFEIATANEESDVSPEVLIVSNTVMVDNIVTTDGEVQLAKNNESALAPTPTDDFSEGYGETSIWIDNETTPFICVDSTNDAAVWVDMSGSGGNSGGTTSGSVPIISSVLAAGEILTTNGSAELTTVAPATGYNLNFGTGSNEVAEGDHVHVVANIIGLSAEITDAAGDAAGDGKFLAPLDSFATIPSANLNITGMIKLGTWNVSTNDANISDDAKANGVTVPAGGYYIVSTGADDTPIDGNDTWTTGDWIVSNGTDWIQLGSSEKVSSVSGKAGNVVLDKKDVQLEYVDNTVVNLTATTDPTTTSGYSDKSVWVNTDSGGVWMLNSETWQLLTNKNTTVHGPNLEGFDRKELADYITKYSAINKYGPSTVGSYTLAGTTFAYAGAVYSPVEQRAYFIPRNTSNETSWSYIDSTGAIATYTHGFGIGIVSSAYSGGAYHAGLNRIYLSPNAIRSETHWHYIDCDPSVSDANKLVSYAHNIIIPVSETSGAVSTGNRVFFITTGNTLMWTYIDETGVVDQFGALSNGRAENTRGGVYSPEENRIYITPYWNITLASQLHYIDTTGTPFTGSITNIYSGEPDTHRGFTGGAYSPTLNRIYLSRSTRQSDYANDVYIDCDPDVPNSNKMIEYVLDTTPSTSYDDYLGAVFVPVNNRIYFVPHMRHLLNSTMMYINCDDGSVVHYNTDDVVTHNIANAYARGVYHPTLNRMYWVPNNAVSDGVYIQYDVGEKIIPHVMSSPMFNKA
jgi:hypothetical protein